MPSDWPRRLMIASWYGQGRGGCFAQEAQQGRVEYKVKIRALPSVTMTVPYAISNVRVPVLSDGNEHDMHLVIIEDIDPCNWHMQEPQPCSADQRGRRRRRRRISHLKLPGLRRIWKMRYLT